MSSALLVDERFIKAPRALLQLDLDGPGAGLPFAVYTDLVDVSDVARGDESLASAAPLQTAGSFGTVRHVEVTVAERALDASHLDKIPSAIAVLHVGEGGVEALSDLQPKRASGGGHKFAIAPEANSVLGNDVERVSSAVDGLALKAAAAHQNVSGAALLLLEDERLHVVVVVVLVERIPHSKIVYT